MYSRNRAGYEYLYLTLILLLFYSARIGAADKVPEFFTFTFENDAFVGQDTGYTNGMGITFGKGPFKEFDNETLPNWLHWLTEDLYVSTMKNKQRAVTHTFFQRMQTPKDISNPDLITGDLPYAGLLAWRGTMYAWDDQVADQLSLYLGAVGPVSLAEQTQTFVHKLIGSDKPEGWDNQIGNEPVFTVEAQRVWNLYRSAGKGRQFDILGLGSVGVGNLESTTRAGLALRWGTNLRYSFPAFGLQADRQVNPLALTSGDDFYLFLAGRVGVVFNNIFVDGNTFKDSPSIPLDHNQDQVSAGAVWSIGQVAFVFQLTSISSSTEIVNRREKYGAINITYRY